MLVDIDNSLDLPIFKLTYHKRNEDEIAELESAYDKNYDHYFAEIDELHFKIPYYIQDMNHNRIKNPHYDLIKGGFLINLNEMHYFIVDDIVEDDSNGEIFKQVNCFSREYELVDKKLRGYKFDARKIYVDPWGAGADTMYDDDGFYWGIMNEIYTTTTWRVNYMNSTLENVYRGFDISEDNLISIIQKIQVDFDCLFQFDTINKEFNIYKLDELGQNKGLYISDENYITKLTKNSKYEEIKTRLYLYGKDNISIEDLSISGQPYIENFDFFKTDEYMSQDLITALDDYDIYISTFEGTFAGYLVDLETYQTQLQGEEDDLAILYEELAVIEQDIDIAISSDTSIGTLNTNRDDKQGEVDAKILDIEATELIITDINDDIETLRSSIASDTYFTSAQLEELDPFIKYETFSDSSYTEELKDDLYEYGLKKLNRISQPKYEFSVDSVDFLSVLEAQFDWEKLVVGDIVNIRHTKINDTVIEVRLISYKYNEEKKDLELNFSNKNNINDPYTYNRDLLKKLSATSTSVDFSKYGWDEAPIVSDLIQNYIDNELNLAKQDIIQAKDQAPILDDRGLWLRKRNLDGTYAPEQIRAVNNVIALTEDNWNTVSTAITPQGIVAEKITGEIGTLATIRADQITVGGVIDPVLIDTSNLVELDTEYNYVQINSTDGFKASHLDGSNTTISGDGVQRNLAIPQYTKSYTGVANGEDFAGETISSLEAKGWEFSANKVNFSVHPDGYLVLDDNVNEPGYDIGMIMARKYVYITDDNVTYSYDFKMGSLDNCYYRFMLDGNIVNLPETSIWDATATGIVNKGWHVFQWEGFNYPYDSSEDVILHLDNVIFEPNIVERTLSGYESEIKEYNYITYLGTANTYSSTTTTSVDIKMTGSFGGLNETEIKAFVSNKIIKLPEEFEGRDFNVVLALKDTNGQPVDSANIARIELDVVSKDTVNAEFTVKGIITWTYFYNDGGLVTFPTAFTGLEFTYYVTY